MNELDRRRTFAIISHPDAGKTTLTEKFLLFGGQIQVAGAVKALSEADTLIIGGTSLVVYPAASFINYFRGNNLVVINLERLDVSHRGNLLQIQGKIGEVFSQLED